MPYTGSVQTFLSLQKKIKPFHEFTPAIHPLREFKIQSYHFAYYLMNLWISKPQHESHHFFGLIQSQNLVFKGEMKDIDSVSPESIHQHFLQNQALHLGYLTFFNLLFCGDPVKQKIFMVKSSTEEKYFFSQKMIAVWHDYFSPEQQHIHFFSTHEQNDKLKCYLQKPHEWWEQALAGTDVRTVLLEEFFEVFLRIYITPWDLIKKIAYQTIDSRFNIERKKILSFFKNKLNSLFIQYENFLTLEEQEKWSNFLLKQGMTHFLSFNHQFDDFCQQYSFCNAIDEKILKNNILVHAINLNIPNLESFITRDKIFNYAADTQALIFDYLNLQIQKHWQSLCSDSRHPLWACLEDFAAGMVFFNNHISLEVQEELIYLLSKAIRFHYYYFSRFLLTQQPALQNSINTINSDESIANHSIFYISLLANNQKIIDFLKQLDVKLLKHERIDLQQLIWKCLKTQNKNLFQFLLKSSPEILDILNEESLSFRSQLEQHCESEQPDFLPLIPPMFKQHFQFFQTFRRYDTDSSESDEEFNENVAKIALYRASSK